jgi:GT2 family glycosyltransferase
VGLPDGRPGGVEPLVSVVVPARDRAPVVPAAVASALPPGSPVEVVVVDDGSTDETADAARAVGDGRVQVLRIPPSGACAARNVGARRARGAWLLFLDSDDVLVEGWFTAFAKAVAPDVGLVLGSAQIWEADRDRWDTNRPAGVAADVRLGVGFLAGEALIRRDVFLATGGYDERLTYSENEELAMRLGPELARSGLQVRRVAAVTVRYVPRSAARGTAYLPARERSALHLLCKHPQAFAAAPDVAAAYWRIIAHARFTSGRTRAGLAALREALRVRPGDAANWRSAASVAVRGTLRARPRERGGEPRPAAAQRA